MRIEVRFTEMGWEVSHGRCDEELQTNCWSYSQKEAIRKGIALCKKYKESGEHSEILLTVYREDGSIRSKDDFSKEDTFHLTGSGGLGSPV